MWLTGLVAPQHVGSSRIRDRTHVPCIVRWILNHCTTREALWGSFFVFFKLIATYLFIYLFIFSCVGSSFCARAFSSCGKRGPLFIVVRGHSSSRCVGLSLSRPLPLRGTGSRRAGSAVVAHGPSCSTACGIFPGQGSNPCPLH